MISRLVLTVLAVYVLVGCGIDTPSPSPPTVSDRPDGVALDIEPEPTAPEAEPTHDQTSRSAAVTTAEGCVAALVQTVPYDQWWDGLSAWLEPDLAQSWSWTDPANVVGTVVTGPGVVVEDVSAWVLLVDVPTDAGPWHVTVARDDHGSWAVRDLVPPVGH